MGFTALKTLSVPPGRGRAVWLLVPYLLCGFLSLPGSADSGSPADAHAEIKSRYIRFLLGDSTSPAGAQALRAEADFVRNLSNLLTDAEDLYTRILASPDQEPYVRTPFSRFSKDDPLFPGEQALYKDILERFLPALAYAYTFSPQQESLLVDSSPAYLNPVVRDRYLWYLDYLQDRGIRPGMTFHNNASRLQAYVNAGNVIPPGAGNLVSMDLRMGSYCQAALLMESHIPPDHALADAFTNCLETVQFLEVLGFLSGHTEYWLPQENPYTDPESEPVDLVQSDAIQNFTDINIVAALLETDPQKQVEDLNRIQRVLEDSLTIIPGWADTIKPDFTGYHHRGASVNSYTSGFMVQAAIGCMLLEDTSYEVAATPVENLRQLTLQMRLYHQKYDTLLGGNRLRFPYSGDKLRNEAFAAFVIYASDNGFGDPEAKRAWARLWDDTEVGVSFVLQGGRGKIFRGMELAHMLDDLIAETQRLQDPLLPEADTELNGLYIKPYGGFAVHRRDDWMIGVRGTSRYIWDFERDGNENVYGYYDSHGVVTLLTAGTPVGEQESGIQLDAGWDWNRPPGATTVHVPYELSPADLLQDWVFNSQTFLGGVSDGQNGTFAMILEDSDHPYGYHLDLHARKSVFFSGDLAVLLGTGISAGPGVAGSFDLGFTFYDDQFFGISKGGMVQTVAEDTPLTLGGTAGDSIRLHFTLAVDDTATPPQAIALDQCVRFGLAGAEDKLTVAVDASTASGDRLRVAVSLGNDDVTRGGALFVTDGVRTTSYTGGFLEGPTEQLDTLYTLLLTRQADGSASLSLSQNRPESGSDWFTETTLTQEEADGVELDRFFLGIVEENETLPDIGLRLDGFSLQQNGQEVDMDPTWRVAQSSGLVGGLQTRESYPVETTVFQNFHTAASVPATWNGASIDTDRSQNGFAPVVLTDRFGNGYYIPNGRSLKAATGVQNSIDHSGRTETSGTYTTVWFDHGDQPEDASYETALWIQGGGTVQQLAEAPDQFYQVQAATDQLHKVYFPREKQTHYVFFNAGTSPDASDLVQEVSDPCVVLTTATAEGWEISVANPDLAFDLTDPPDPIFYRWIGEDPERLFAPSLVIPTEVRFKGLWRLQTSSAEVLSVNYDTGSASTRLVFTCRNGETVRVTLVPMVAERTALDFSQVVHAEGFETVPAGQQLPETGLWTTVLATPPDVTLQVEEDSQNLFASGPENQLLHLRDQGDSTAMIRAEGLPGYQLLRIRLEWVEPAEQGDGDVVLRIGKGTASPDESLQEVRIRNNASSTDTYWILPGYTVATYGQRCRLDLFLNESPDAITYIAPDGTFERLEPMRMDVWVNGVLSAGADDAVYRRSDAFPSPEPITGLRLQTFSSARETLYLDHLELAVPYLAAPWSPYSWWTHAQGIPYVENGPGDDADADGIANFQEYALGGDPLTPEASPLMTLVRNPAGLGVVFDRLSPSLTPEMLYQVETSSTLMPDSWSEINLTPVVEPLPGGYERHRIPLPLPDTEPGLYYRLRLEER